MNNPLETILNNDQEHDDIVNILDLIHKAYPFCNIAFIDEFTKALDERDDELIMDSHRAYKELTSNTTL